MGYEQQRKTNPVGGESNPSFAELVESAFQSNRRFDKFLRHVLEDVWHVSPEVFCETMQRNLDRYLARLQDKKDFDLEKLPHALRRYIKEREGMGIHSALPTPAMIKSWITGATTPDGTQIAAMSYAFSLSSKQEHMLFKSARGKKLTLQQVIETIEKGDGAVLGKLLVRASGFTEERLAELIDVPQRTLNNWIARDSSVKPGTSDNLDAINRFAQLLIQCMDGGEFISSLRLSDLHKDIAIAMTDGKVAKRLHSPQDAAAEFRNMFEHAFARGENLSQFLNHILREWDETVTCLNFLNLNNASTSSDYEPIKERTFFDWVTGASIPNPGHIIRIATGAEMDRLQELKLWKMTHGKPITAAEVDTCIAAGNSGILLKTLIDAAGIGRNQLLRLLDTDTSTYADWTSQDNPRLVSKMKKANVLADLLLPLIKWAPPLGEKNEKMRERFLEVISGQKADLFSTVAEALKHEKPHARLFHALADTLQLSNPELAEALGISFNSLMHFKKGARVSSEAEALRLIEASGGGDEFSVRKAVDVLTQTRSPSELLDLAKQEKISIGKVCEETRKRRHLSRADVQRDYGVDSSIVGQFENESKPVDLDIAEKLAGFIGFAAGERHHFIGMATGDAKYLAFRKRLQSTDSFLQTWDKFASRSRKQEIRQSLLLTRAFLSGLGGERGEGIGLNDAFGETAKSITWAASPDETVSDKEWQGKVFDAANILLYQRLCHCRKRLDLGGIANSEEIARHQRNQLYKDPEGKQVLNAFIALNNGYVMGRARKKEALTSLPKYAEDRAALWTDMWMGYESKAKERELLGGVLDSFLQWDPQISAFTTFASERIKWQIENLKRRAKSERHERSNRLDSQDEEGRPKQILLDDVARQQFEDNRKREDEVDEAHERVQKVFSVVQRLPDPEKALLMAAFSGHMSGDVNKLDDLGEEASATGQRVTREAVRLRLEKAKGQFRELWKKAYPDEPFPLGLESFLARPAHSENRGL